jgi:uncharacterized protein (TIGR02996 family)|nr:TIGR02996 domain-containing protein [Kofleriaceae bacterium]
MRVFERDGERVEIEVHELRVSVRRARGGEAAGDDVFDATTEVVAKWEADRVAAQLVADGFTRVDRAASYASQAELIAQLAAAPDDLDTYGVLADWLDERGDPWGRVIAVQTAIARLPAATTATWRALAARRDELARVEQRLLFQHAARLWGSLGDTIVDAHTQSYAFDRLRPDWRCGFVRAIAPGGDGLAYLPAFAELAIAQLLDAMAVAIDSADSSALSAIGDARWPRLRTLTVTCSGYDDDRQALDGAAVAALVDADKLPRLDELAVSLSRNTDAICRAVTAPGAPRLRVLALHGASLTERGVAALAAAPLPGLESLVITGAGPADAADRLRDKATVVRVAFA